MKHITYCLLAASLLLGCSHERESSIEADYVFENVNIISMEGDSVQRNQVVAVKDKAIVAIVNQSNASLIQAPIRIDGQARYLMPGLADMHVHVRWNPEAMFKLFVAHGVTTVANMWIDDGKWLDSGPLNHLSLREQIRAGELLGPRYLLSGPHLQDDYPPNVNAVDKILDEHIEKKYDFVKVHGDLSVDIYDALLSGSKQRGLRIIGHAQHAMPLARSLELDAIEHIEEILYVSRDQEFAKELEHDFLNAYRKNVENLKQPDFRSSVINDIAATDVVIDPTLIVYKSLSQWSTDELLLELRNDPDMKYIDKKVREHWLSLETNPYQEEGFPLTKEEIEGNFELMLTLTKELNDAGVPLLLGTDTFGTLIPGKSAHRELALLVDAGLSPYEALKASTVNVANYLDESDTSGAIKPGYRADFILLDRNPLDDINNSKTVSGVFMQGRWHDRQSINRLLNEVELMLQ